MRGLLPGMVALGAAFMTAPAQASFVQEGTPITVGAQPYGVVAADFNGDARADVATVNGTSSNLSVLLRQAAGGFAAETGSPFAVGAGPDYGHVADFNGDGLLDVTVGNFVGNSVSVLLRQASGGFTAEPAPPVASASSVAVADFNGDGRPDIASPSYNGASVTTLLRQAAGGFVAEPTRPGTGINPRDLAAADFNGDGLPDLAVTNLGSASVTILLRSAAGGF
ncbi:MAG TPA: VCBS repeat-containing protein, partial [Solirubrobacteraceae bacterium]|nr:VCBS repeat-containing protein [Solirubrobacteraceae bacterium]